MAGIEGVVYERRGKVAVITIDRAEKRNALSPQVIEGIHAYLSRAREDPHVRVVVVTGAGEKAFCAGADLGETMSGERSGAVAAHYARKRLADVFSLMACLGKPLVARVNGHALAGGLGLAAAADFVVAVDDATFGTPEVDVGLWPMMITVILRRAMPPKKALQLMLTGRRIGAEEARSLGLVDVVVARDSLDATVLELCEELGSKSPDAIRVGRDAFYRSLGMPDDEALAYLAAELSVLVSGEEAVEGIRAFSEKRPPRWRET